MEKTSETESDDFSKKTASSRLADVSYNLLRIHVDMALAEAERDEQRLLRGVLCWLFGVGFMLLMLLTGQAFAIWVLHRLGLSFGSAIGVMAGCDLLFGMLLLRAGRRALRAPVLPQTRALLRRTVSALLSP